MAFAVAQTSLRVALTCSDSRRQDPTPEEAAVTRRQLEIFAPKHNFTFCEGSGDTDAESKGTGGETAWGSARALRYAAPKDCIDDDAVAEVWRLTQETHALGLWDRIYVSTQANPSLRVVSGGIS